MSRDLAHEDTISELYRRIAGVTTRYDFAAPVEDADLDHVQRELSGAIPAHYIARVRRSADPRYVDVEVFGGGRRVYRRPMIVS